MNKHEHIHCIDSPSVESARLWAVQRLTRVAEQFPMVEPPDMDLGGLSSPDAALALAIYRTTVQRWFTLQHLLETFLSKQLRRLEPGMQAVLMSGAAQLVFFDRLPAYAVVDESVSLARQWVRPNAASMVNAVLRQLDRLISKANHVSRWSPSPAMIPMPDGAALQLPQPILPDTNALDKHLVVATSMPLRLVREWMQRWGDERAMQLCMHSIQNPPTTLAVEQPFEPGSDAGSLVPHAQPGCMIWTGPASDLAQFLAGNPSRRVQDAASMQAVESTREFKPNLILDYCAGQGTKTRQLALMHPNATIIATDTHTGRRTALRTATTGMPNVRVVEPQQAGEQTYDLILLDVPCSNTGVLARRPEARYRYTQQSVGDLVQLQRQIIQQVLPWLGDAGLLLYSTCSIEPSENHNQIKRLVKQGAVCLHEHQHWPQGSADTYTDASYHALLRL